MSNQYNFHALNNITQCRSVASRGDLPDYVRVIITTDSHGRQRELLIPAALDLDRPKRPRTTFQSWQIEEMESEFQSNPFVTEKRRRELANTLGITETQVKVWFQNRRTKIKNEKGKVCTERHL